MTGTASRSISGHSRPTAKTTRETSMPCRRRCGDCLPPIQRFLSEEPASARRLPTGFRLQVRSRSGTPIWSRTAISARTLRSLSGPPAPYIPNQFVLSGLGSRGLVTAPLLAETVVSMMFGEPLPIPIALAHALHPGRFCHSRSEAAPIVLRHLFSQLATFPEHLF